MDTHAAMLALPTRTQEPDFRATTQTVTPAMAQAWLQQADRPHYKVDERAIEACARDMRAGAWKLNGEPIIFSKKHRLLAGRVRLAACIRANVPFRTLVVENIEDSTFESTDALRKRTVGDILHIRRKPNGPQLASALAIIWRYHIGDFPTARKRSSSLELLSILDHYPEISTTSLKFAKEAAPDMAHSIGTAVHFLFSRVSRERADEFFQQFIDQPSGAPATVLRAHLKEMASRGRRVQPAVLAVTIKAWNAFYEGRELAVLRYVPDREKFPSIAGLDEAESSVFTEGEDAQAAHSTWRGGTDPDDNHELKAEYAFVTPDLSKELLAKNDGNRSIAEAVVARYRRDMAAGQWQLNGQTIKIGRSGKLLDGQHRCQAAIQSGKGFPAIIVREVDDDAFDTVDLGASRGFHVVLAERGEKSTVSLAASLKWVWLYEQTKIFDRATSPTHAELDAVMDRHPDIKKSLKLANKVRHVIAPGLGIALHYLFTSKDAAAADEFFDRLCDGQNLDKTMPVWHLRDKLLKDRSSRKVKILEGERFALAVKAWNAFRENREMGVLSWRRRGPGREIFPQIA